MFKSFFQKVINLFKEPNIYPPLEARKTENPTPEGNTSQNNTPTPPQQPASA